MNTFQAKHIQRTHPIILNAPVSTVFPLFTPAGETLWVDDWNPRFLQPVSGETEKGMVFTTDVGGSLTLWGVTDYDPENHYVRYARVTPDSRFGFVEVLCETIDASSTRAKVTYTYTALTDAGNQYLEEFTEDNFRRMIDSWQTDIHAYLRRTS